MGSQWTRAGHEVMISSRTPERVVELARRIGAQVGTWAEAASFGDVVLLAVRAEGVADVLGAVDVAGKVVVDCTNSVVQREWTLAVPRWPSGWLRSRALGW